MLMTRQEIFDKLKKLLVAADSGNLAITENCTEQSRLREDFGMNSVNILYMVIAIEEAFGIVFDDVGVNAFATVGEAIDYIERKLR
ncbi:MAG: hypothetical protein IJ598_07675 [Ruminococcus sp.]|nr:hypothetical protein [Ruminococcus sp.]